MNKLRPALLDAEGFEGRFLWRIKTADDTCDSWAYQDVSSDLGFATRSDCELAIAALKQHGITDDAGMESISDERLAAICLSNLRW